MDKNIQAAYDNLIEQGFTLRDIIESAIEYSADCAVEEHADDGIKIDPDDAYDALVEGIRSSAERKIVGQAYRPPLFDPASE